MLAIQLKNKISELLELSLAKRVKSFKLLLTDLQCPELIYVYQHLVDSIFGINKYKDDWGLVNVKSADEIILKSFLAPNGQLLVTACELVTKDVQLLFNHKILSKVLQTHLIRNTGCTGFYENMIELNLNETDIDNFSINPFEYYMTCFALAGIQIFSKLSMDLSEEKKNKATSFYMSLAVEYFNMYLPISPTADIIPFMSHESMRPYQKNTSEAMSDLFESLPNKQNISLFYMEDFRVASVLRFFMDIWFYIDIKSTKDLPCGYFLELQTEFVKHIFKFSITYKGEGFHMACLRENSLCLLRTRFHRYIWELFRYWPLDKTFSYVLQIWLTYLEPWAYSYNENRQSEDQIYSQFIWNERVQNFLQENLEIYTQIFLDVLPCLEKFDYFSEWNMEMLKMVVNFFSDEEFMVKLKATEQNFLNKLKKEQLEALLCSIDKKFLMVTEFEDWDQLFVRSEYVPAFHTFTLIMFKRINRSLCDTIIDLKMKIIDLGTQIESVYDNKTLPEMLLNIQQKPLEKQVASKTETLNKLTYILDNFRQSIFQIEIRDIPSYTELWHNRNSKEKYNLTAEPNILNIRPKHGRYLFSNICVCVDPAFSPNRIDECMPVVYLMEYISHVLNDWFGVYVDIFSTQENIIGQFLRCLPILLPRITIHKFSRHKGFQEINEINLPTRICLRPFANYWAIAAFIICIYLYSKDIRYFFIHFLIVTAFTFMKYLFNYLLCL